MEIETTIRETDGLWTVVVTWDGNVWSRHAWTNARANEIARDLQQLARDMQMIRANRKER